MNILDWLQFKLFMERASGVSMDALHILAGFAIFLFVAAVLRRSIASGWPLMILLLLELCNEAYDLGVERWPDMGMQLGEGLKDIVLTIALPALMTVVVRWRPTLIHSNFRRREGS